MASSQEEEESATVVYEAALARAGELVRALLKPVGAAEPYADVVARVGKGRVVALMARVLSPAVTREDVDLLAVVVAASELLVAVRERGRSLNAPSNMVEEAVTYAVAEGVTYADALEARLQAGAKTTFLGHASAFPYLVAAFVIVVATLTVLVVCVVCN